MSGLGSVGGRLYRGEVSVDFVGKRRMWYTISALIILVSLIALLVRGLSFSVEFKGGAVFGVNGAPASVTVSQVQKATADGGVTDAIVQHVGTGSAASWQVQTKELSQAQSNAVRTALANELNVQQSQVSVN